jgi:hypothetical protein
VEPEAVELIAESAAELAEICAFIESAGLELLAVIAIATRPKLAAAPESAA